MGSFFFARLVAKTATMFVVGGLWMSLTFPAMANGLPDPDAEGLSAADRIEALVQRVKHEQEQLETLRANFVQRKESMLLLEAEEAHGTFVYQAPDQLRWDYTSPDETVVLIQEDEMLTWYRDLNRAEKINVGGKTERILQFLGASQSLGSLQRYFDLRISFPKDPSAPYRMELDPRYARVAKRIQSMTIHLDRQLYLPVYLRYEEPDGDVTEYRFEELKVNGSFAEEVFDIDLPESTEVTVIDLAQGDAEPAG